MSVNIEIESRLVEPTESPEQEAFSHEQLTEMTELYRAEYPKLVRRAQKFAVSDPEGIAQVVFEKALKNWNRYRDMDDGRGRGPWLNTILTNTAISELRRANHRESKDHLTGDFHDHSDLTTDHSVGIQYENAEEAPYTLHEHVKNLLEQKNKPAAWAKMLLLSGEGYSYGEISKILDIPKGTVQTGLFRAKKVLAEDELLRAAFGEFEDEIEKVQ